MRVCVVDCGSGNLASAARALTRAASLAGIDAEIEISGEADAVLHADRIVLPGQGAFATCMRGLTAAPGLLQAIERRADDGAPFLGICVGMQLMARRGLEHTMTQGFGWLDGEVAALEAPGLRLPHMGWNALEFGPEAHPLLEGVASGDHVYFVHSYGLTRYNPEDVLATTDYGGPVPALVARGNRAGTQFHVEKSQEVGLRILANFLRWSPTAASCPAALEAAA
jgi:glutamine amidotransferase